MAVFLCIAELWQPTFISSPVCDIVGDAQRAYRYGDSAKCCAEKTLFAGPGRGVFYELRVTRSDVVSVSLLPRSGIRRGRPVKASRYALRVSRSVVVSLSLSRRNAASESAKKAVARGSCFVTRKSSPSFRMGCGQISQRAALRDGPYELRTTNNEQQKSTSRRPTSPAESRLSLSGCILSHHQVTRFGISDSHGFARRKAPSKPVPCLSQGTLVG